jgi:hypothetical protein
VVPWRAYQKQRFRNAETMDQGARLMSTYVEMECMGTPVTLELTDEGDVIFHGWDEEVELAAQALGLDASPCWIVAGAIKEDRLDHELIERAKIGDVQIVEALLGAGADVHAENDDALRWAAERGHRDIVAMLLDAGADVHAAKDFALRWAAEKGYRDIVAMLLDADDDPDAWNESILREAATSGSAKAEQLLRRRASR